MQPTKVLYCIDSLIQGGTELQLIGLIERLDAKKYTPYLLTIRETDNSLVPKNCTHLAWQVPKLISVSGIQAMMALIKFLRREKIDIVQTFFQDSTLFAGTAAYITSTKVRIACFRDLGFWYSKKQALLLGMVYRGMSGYICNADIVQNHFVDTFSLAADKSVVLRNGIDVIKLPFINHTNDVMHVGIVGNMTRQVKRTDLFIKAAAIVALKHPNITWHIIGDGHMRLELEDLAKNLHISNKVCFAGRVSAVADYLEKLDIGIICSDSEGLSNALLEYMFKGVAAIATNVGGNPELIIHEETGLLIPPDNEYELADAIVRLISDKNLRHSVVLSARLTAEKQYSWEKCINSHDEYYQEQLAKESK